MGGGWPLIASTALARLLTAPLELITGVWENRKHRAHILYGRDIRSMPIRIWVHITDLRPCRLAGKLNRRWAAILGY